MLTSSGYTYGALATPIAFLLFAFLLGLSIVLGAHFNHALEEVWPSGAPLGERRSERLRAAARRGSDRVTGAAPRRASTRATRARPGRRPGRSRARFAGPETCPACFVHNG